MRIVIWNLLSVERLAKKRNLDGPINVSKHLETIADEIGRL